MRVRLGILALLCLLPGAAWAQRPPSVVIDARSCFEGMSPRGGVYPLLVSVQNRGASVDGALTVHSDNYSDALRSYDYPVSLPTGTTKQLIVYPVVNNYTFQVSLSFDGNARSQDINLPLQGRQGWQVGLIGDEVGALAVLRMARKGDSPSGQPVYPGQRRISSSATQYNDCYARPEEAPDRAAGYQSLGVLVLGAGAERLRPGQWAAIRQWVMEGGSLLLLGGAGATYLRTPEAAPLLPVAGVRDSSLIGLRLPPIETPPLPGGDIALAVGAPKPGATVLAAQGGQALLVRQSLGVGTVLFVAFDPLDKPFRDWAGRRELWVGLMRQAAATAPASSLRAWTTGQTSFQQENIAYSVGPGAGRTVTMRNGVDPFRIKLPPLTTVAWILLAYFVLAVPVTYIVLKRLGRLEWAWVTGPVLSVAFAYGFYLFTAQLYLAGQARRTAGVIVAVAGNPQARFDGFTETFFPQGGRYQIDIPGAEALELSPFMNSEEYYGSSSQLQSLETADVGQVVAPSLTLGNLAFRRLYHTEPITLGGTITANLWWDKAGGLAGTVRNGTGQTLTDCGVLLPGPHLYARVGDLPPGATKTVGEVNATSGNGPIPGLVPLSARAEKGVPTGGLLMARTSGAKYGPQLGRDVGGSNSVAVLVSVPLGGGPRP